MKMLLLDLGAAVVWVAFTGNGEFSNFISGFILADLILWFISPATKRPSFLRNVVRYIPFLLNFIKEYILSNVKIIKEILTPGYGFKPGIIAVPLEDMTDLQITCLSNMITLTPGTFTLDMSPDRKTLFVHAMYIDTVQEAVDEIKNGFERQVRETLR